jgi:hypothetical protein
MESAGLNPTRTGSEVRMDDEDGMNDANCCSCSVCYDLTLKNNEILILKSTIVGCFSARHYLQYNYCPC